jgi:hypothetical protein
LRRWHVTWSDFQRLHDDNLRIMRF